MPASVSNRLASNRTPTVDGTTSSWQPDRERGVFETLLVLDGHPVERDAHLTRLHNSLTTLYPTRTPTPPLDVPSLMCPYGHISDGTSVGEGVGAMRITVAPRGGDGLAARVEWREAPRGGSVSLRGLALPGGLGTHKWVDRGLLDDVQAKLPDDSLPLILDQDGAVLEASRANIFAVRDGALFTPPLDGRLLPGITRMRVLEIAAAEGIEVREATLSRADLLAADEVFLTGSVRGIEPAASLDGTALSAGGPITPALSGALRRAWLGAPVA